MNSLDIGGHSHIGAYIEITEMPMMLIGRLLSIYNREQHQFGYFMLTILFKVIKNASFHKNL